ncbi:hypothetical protein AWC01_15805 [Mycobacterium doricum]|uniref:Uncharacterized protein n=1 Tax=Mycolicibacterium doricum TaxID=126673 RepID=A0A1X1T022_9MYCO|nr:hypothetical protein AWC01_15805 [Mycolicibacterium doricum]
MSAPAVATPAVPAEPVVVPTMAAFPATGTKVACAAIPLEVISELVDPAGRRSGSHWADQPLLTCAATFAGTTMR